MPYMLMIMEPRGQRRTRTREEGEHVFERMVRFGEDLKSRGLLLAVESLQSDTKGVRVEVRNGKRNISDGPFTEAKEMIGGFFLLDCKTKEEAVTIAQQCPAAEWATIEVRGVGPCFDD
ncbi:dehydrogenase [Pyxidicoccus fallax]|uniref:Dehydrogenase n=1 Tax=Pyxidicoccus fallax TaxID=394095 RepID=A0A848L402_9BACT|nr:YciI family protein [Pyxidicoccus fallax]NMO13680.1 dehydrogenase [Pyxidicoccus fallax]NPC76832.1 dehydrogenase [Pyxidicoccus fallax]